MDAIDEPSALLNEADTQPSQVAQILLFLARNKAGGEEAMLQQIGDPVGILDVGFSARHRSTVSMARLQTYTARRLLSRRLLAPSISFFIRSGAPAGA
jgi:hypothetical protein